MREIPNYFWEWAELDFEYHTAMRLVKPNVPSKILKNLLQMKDMNFNRHGEELL